MFGRKGQKDLRFYILVLEDHDLGITQLRNSLEGDESLQYGLNFYCLWLSSMGDRIMAPGDHMAHTPFI